MLQRRQKLKTPLPNSQAADSLRREISMQTNNSQKINDIKEVCTKICSTKKGDPNSVQEDDGWLHFSQIIGNELRFAQEDKRKNSNSERVKQMCKEMKV